MAAMKCCLHGVAGILLAAGGVTAVEAQTFIAPEAVQQPATAVVTTVPPAPVLAQPAPVETTRQVTTTYRTSDHGRVVRRTVVTTRTSPVAVPPTVTGPVVAAPVTVAPAPAYAASPYAVQSYTTVVPVIDQVGPPAEVVAPVAPARAYRYVYLDDRTLVVDPVTNVVLATYWR